MYEVLADGSQIKPMEFSAAGGYAVAHPIRRPAPDPGPARCHSVVLRVRSMPCLSIFSPS